MRKTFSLTRDARLFWKYEKNAEYHWNTINLIKMYLKNYYAVDHCDMIAIRKGS